MKYGVNKINLLFLDFQAFPFHPIFSERRGRWLI
jgi:hypothetical protein